MTHVGAIQLGKTKVAEWTRPLFDAFIAGCWLIHFTEDTLFWVAKPVVHVENADNDPVRRLHNADYAALESDLENIYFWHGVYVPAFVVVRPEWITAKMALGEENAEVRRVMIERMGMERFIAEAGAKIIHSCADFCHPDASLDLFSIDLPDDPEGCLRTLRMTDPSTCRTYLLRVPPSIKRADDAKAWTFGFDVAKEYQPAAET